jgi:hypothetical protein
MTSQFIKFNKIVITKVALILNVRKLSTIYNMSGRVVSDIQTRAENDPSYVVMSSLAK